MPINKPLPLPPLPKKSRKSRHGGVAFGDESADWQKIRVYSPDSVSSSNSRASTSSSRSSLSQRSTSTAVAPNAETEEGWRVRFTGSRPPLLRLGFGKSDKLPSYQTPSPSYSDTSYPDTETAPPPSFVIRSDASIKREKMRRLTKKLGEGVPIDLVFPPSVVEEDEDVLIHSPLSPSSPSSPSSTLSSSSSLESTSSASSASTTSSASTLISVYSDSSSGYGKYRMGHEAFQQPPRRSHFAKDVPDFPCQDRQLTVHYETPEEHGHGSETFEGLKRAFVPPARSRRSVSRKPVPHIHIP